MAPRLLDESELAPRLGEVDWQRDGNELVKQVTLADFAAALEWVNRVGALAEEHNHHPDIAISWNKVTLRLSTHSAGGLTDMDFDLAHAVDAIGT
jgi:4a-hydroxytetrahydrobiopterin dehydratase